MKAIIAIIMLSLMCVSAAAGEESDKTEVLKLSDAKLLELEGLPVGISVNHSPDPVLATWHGREEWKCKWTYATTVSSLAESVKVDEFGMFTWDCGRWYFVNFTKKPFTSGDFAEWYSCLGAELISGTKFTDSSNWSASCSLKAGKSRWYFIGTDRNGNRVKGEATVELAAQFEDSAE